MTSTEIPHGTYSGYQYHLCRCRDCTTAYSTYVRERRRLQRYGQWNPHADMTQVRAHIEHLIAAGWTAQQIDLRAGVWEGCTRRVLNDPGYRMAQFTASCLLGVGADTRGCPTRPARGAMNRLRCLCAIGYGLPWVAERTGLAVRGLSYIRSGHRKRVNARVHEAVVGLYQEWADTPAPEDRFTAQVRAVAQRNGWGPPAAWDDHWLDLSEGELAAELERLVRRMDRAELSRCHKAALAGELSPLVLAAAKEFNRVRAAEDRAREARNRMGVAA